MIIKPTIGRVVWYHPDKPHEQPWAAFVVFVHPDGKVNLSVFDENGLNKSKLEVILVQEGEEKPEWHYCEWMPYQIGQAKNVDKSREILNTPIAK